MPDLGSNEYSTLHSDLQENILIEIGKLIYIEETRLEEVLTTLKIQMMVNGKQTVILFSLIHNHIETSVVILNYNGQKWLEKFIPTFIKHSVKDAKNLCN